MVDKVSNAALPAAVVPNGAKVGGADALIVTGSPAFIDFGCGNGRSIGFAESVTGGTGLGIDHSTKAVAASAARGHEARLADILTFKETSVTTASFAMDVLPELGGAPEFEQGLINILRASRDYALVQHLCFDSEDRLWARGLFSPAHQGRALHFKPRITDYMQLVDKHAKGLNIVGVAIFGTGELPIEPYRHLSLEVPEEIARSDRSVHRSLRVLIGRKQLSRFEGALKRLSTGERLVMCKNITA